jgi:cobalt-zinc-cadmium efflux system protein
MHHGHSHAVAGDRLRNALVLTVVILVVEVAAGLLANSLALLADAGHILTDVFALGLAWFATRVSTRRPDERNTFGYQRSSILAALVNAVLLVVIAVGVLVAASMRIRHPQAVDGGIVIPGALAAIAVNTYVALGLRAEREYNLNVRAAFLHVVGDLVASVGVVLAGVVIALGKVYVADPLLSVAIALLIAGGAWTIIRDTTAILMEGTPRGIDLDAVRAAMREVPGVEDVHDLHIWALSDGFRLLSAHAEVPEQSLAAAAALIADLKMLLHRRFHIEHATIELECIDCRVPSRRPIQLHPPQRERGSIVTGASEDQSGIGAAEAK